LWTADFLYPHHSTLSAKVHFVFSFYGIIDLMSILPYVLPVFLPYGFVTFRILRVFRVFRLFRINAQYDAFNVVVDVLKKRRQQLFSSIVMIVIMMVASSICMYSIEHEVQPAVFKNAFSGIWWAVSTLLTVGYGDIYPVTLAGQFMAIVIAFLGVGLVAIPTGIISAGFVEQFAQMRSFSEISDGNDMRFIMLTLEDDHPWTGQRVADIVLPPELIIVGIYRAKRLIVPRGQTKFRINDKVVLGALEFKDDIGIEMHEFEITANHPWREQLLKDVRVQPNAVVAAIYRHEKAIVPRGNTQFHLGDYVVVCINSTN
ncbi:MAG: ion transporter, partial [Lachnospiraceae bacterium]|nr:ion transporter [Lachnospiraceae bacterium]